MERLMKPSTVAAITWLKDRLVSTKVPGSRSMIKKAVEELEYRVPKNPDSRYEKSRHETVPICPTCGEELGDYECCSTCGDDLGEIYYCPICGQAIDASYLEEEQ